MAFGKREGFISAYLFGSQSTLKGSQGKNSRKKPGDRNWSRNHGVLLIGFLLMAWSASFLKVTRATSLRLAPPKWAVSYYINHQSRNCTTGQFYGGIISLGVICSQMTPTCIKYMYKIDIKLPSYLQTSFSAFSMCIAIEPFIVHAQPIGSCIHKKTNLILLQESSVANSSPAINESLQRILWNFGWVDHVQVCAFSNNCHHFLYAMSWSYLQNEATLLWQ